MKDLNSIIKKEIRGFFNEMVNDVMREECFLFEEVVNELEFDNYEGLVDRTLSYCKYLSFEMIVELWDEFVENWDDEFIKEIES